MLWTEYRLVIKIGPKVALGSHKIRPIHSAPSLGQSIPLRKSLSFKSRLYRFVHSTVFGGVVDF